MRNKIQNITKMFDNFINILKALKDSIITCTSGNH